MGGACSTHGKTRNAPEGKRPLVRSTRKWEENIRLDLREIGCEGVDWIHLAHDKD
jgi:hypothetical protein